MVGDSISDMQAGENAGCKTLMIGENVTLQEAIKRICADNQIMEF